MLIRCMSMDDYDAVVALWQRCEGVGLNESDQREPIAAYLQRNPGLSLVAVDDEGRIAAAVLCGHDGRRGYLHHLAVDAPYRRNGLGRQLVAKCLAALSQLGIPKCNLFLFADNGAGESFWLRTGWRGRPDLKVLQRWTGGT